MSPVPASPVSPERCSSASSSSVALTPRRWTSQSSRPGSTLPGRDAITRPSIGVKPIVVSTDRPPATAASEAPAPRWHVTTRRSVATQQLGCAARGVRVREPVEAEPAARPLGRQGVGGGRVGERRVERGVEAGGGGRLGQPQGEGVDRRERARLVQRRQLGELEQARAHVVVDPGRRPQRVAAVHDAVRDGVGRRQAVERVRGEGLAGRPLDQARSATRAVAGVEQPQLQAARAGVDDEQPRVSPATSSRARPRDPRRARACRRGGAGARRPCAGAGRRRAGRGRGRGRSRR